MQHADLAKLIIALLFALPHVANAGINDGLVANWTFDGCTLRDYSAFAHHGSIVDGSLSCTTGVKNDALKLNGDNYVEIKTKTALPVNNGDSFSVSLWMNYQGTLGACGQTNMYETLGYPLQYISYNLTSFETQEHLGVSLFCPSHSGWKYAFSFSQYVYSQIFVYPSGEAPIMKDKWYHVVYIMNRETDKVEVYYNGVKGSGGDAAPGFLINSEGELFTIGAGEITSYNATPGSVTVTRENGFVGLIDEIKIYNRIITQSEIAQLYTLSYINPEPKKVSILTPIFELLLR